MHGLVDRLVSRIRFNCESMTILWSGSILGERRADRAQELPLDEVGFDAVIPAGTL